jgi:predicted RNase H-like HicB family nuclease
VVDQPAPQSLCFYVFKNKIRSLEIPMKIVIEREEDGRWISEIPELAGVMAYGQSHDEAISKVEAFALGVIADRIEHGEDDPDLSNVFSVAV